MFLIKIKFKFLNVTKFAVHLIQQGTWLRSRDRSREVRGSRSSESGYEKRTKACIAHADNNARLFVLRPANLSVIPMQKRSKALLMVLIASCTQHPTGKVSLLLVKHNLKGSYAELNFPICKNVWCARINCSY
jgi:hypothetical protein